MDRLHEVSFKSLRLVLQASEQIYYATGYGKYDNRHKLCIPTVVNPNGYPFRYLLSESISCPIENVSSPGNILYNCANYFFLQRYKYLKIAQNIKYFVKFGCFSSGVDYWKGQFNVGIAEVSLLP